MEEDLLVLSQLVQRKSSALESLYIVYILFSSIIFKIRVVRFEDPLDRFSLSFGEFVNIMYSALVRINESLFADNYLLILKVLIDFR